MKIESEAKERASLGDERALLAALQDFCMHAHRELDTSPDAVLVIPVDSGGHLQVVMTKLGTTEPVPAPAPVMVEEPAAPVKPNGKKGAKK